MKMIYFKGHAKYNSVSKSGRIKIDGSAGFITPGLPIIKSVKL